MTREPLPIDEVLGDLTAAVAAHKDAVVIAPPGAGKTTRVPAALLEVLPPAQRILVLEPRRLAARLAAARLARELGGRVGEKVGYQVRFEDVTSAKTRIALVTEGILTRRLQSDPLLEGVSCVVLDEFHERSVHADLGLAFLREVQETVRPDLRIVVMSATLDPTRVLGFLQDAVRIDSDGRLFDVDLRYLERPDERRLAERASAGAKRALRETEGDVLVFLPGTGEIRRTQERLSDLDSVDVLPLYGELDARAQDRAVATGPRRKVILATNLAESSLTIPGVRVVVDTGLEKRLRHDPRTGLDRLELTRISRRSATQRAGRAGRLGPGVAYRLWTQKEEIGFADETPPEIRRIDLASVVLDVLRWSAADPARFGWFEAPGEASLARAVEVLRSLGCLAPKSWALTDRGTRLASLPLHPRVGAMLAWSAEHGILEEGALVAAIASERDVLRDRPDTVGPSDLLLRAERIQHGGPGLDPGAVRTVRRLADRLVRIAKRAFRTRTPSGDDEHALLRAVLAGYADRVGRRRRSGDARVVLADGSGARLAPDSVVKDAELLVAVEIEGTRRGEPWIRRASAIERDWLESDAGGVRTVRSARWNVEREAAEAVVEVRYRALVLETRPDPEGDAGALAEVLAEHATKDLDRALPVTDALAAFFARCAFLAAARSDLAGSLPTEHWRRTHLASLARGRRNFAELAKLDLIQAFTDTMEPAARTALAREAPAAIPIPSGRAAKLRYEAEGPPVLSVRLQEVFGLYESPRVAGVPVKMELLAPNRRPVQVTQDLASFWAHTYATVRKELCRRYPKHQWPEDPADGIASARVRPKKRR